MFGKATFSIIICNNLSPTPHKIGKKAFNLNLHKKDSEIQTKSRFLPPPMKMVHMMGFVVLLRQLWQESFSPVII
jgi:hypothetical protein